MPTVSELKLKLKDLGLPESGTKAALVARLANANYEKKGTDLSEYEQLRLKNCQRNATVMKQLSIQSLAPNSKRKNTVPHPKTGNPKKIRRCSSRTASDPPANKNQEEPNKTQKEDTPLSKDIILARMTTVSAILKNVAPFNAFKHQLDRLRRVDVNIPMKPEVALTFMEPLAGRGGPRRSGYHLFCRDMIQQARKKKAKAPDVKKCAAAWRELSSEAKMQHGKRAKERAAEQTSDLSKEVTSRGVASSRTWTCGSPELMANLLGDIQSDHLLASRRSRGVLTSTGQVPVYTHILFPVKFSFDGVTLKISFSLKFTIKERNQEEEA